MSGRMVFPYEELPEGERGEFAYQEVWSNPWSIPQRFVLGTVPNPPRCVVQRASRGLRRPVKPGYLHVDISTSGSLAFGWNSYGIYYDELPETDASARAVAKIQTMLDEMRRESVW